MPCCRCHLCCWHPTIPHHNCPHCCFIVIAIVVVVCCGCSLVYCVRDGVVVGSRVSQWVGGGRALHSMLGWCHGRACAQWVGSVGVLCSMLRWCHSGAYAWRVSIVVGLACHVGMASWWGLHVVSRHCGWISCTVMGWRWWCTCMWWR